MQIQRLPLDYALGHLLLHNVVDAAGKRVIRKGVQLTAAHIAKLRELSYHELDVAVLATDDVAEDDAAAHLVNALQTERLAVKWGVGGRANLHSTVRGVLYVDADRLSALNRLPGITLATLPQHSVVYPRSDHAHHGQNDQVATLKIIPYAIPVAVLDKALSIAQGQPILDIQALAARRVALLITGERAAQPLLRAQFEPAIRQRLEHLGSTLVTVITTTHEEAAVATTIQPLLVTHELLVIAGQTSIMDEHDPVLDALRDQGATVILHGAPVDPGNLLALADFAGKPILCAPGCARSMAPNVVDLILPRLLVGEQLTEVHIAQMGLGGLLR